VKNLSNTEVKEKNDVEISNRCAALENFDENLNTNSAWRSTEKISRPQRKKI
jgi:hypothetical protein